MNFKDQMAADISAVFLNTDEFADMHDIDGQSLASVVDNDVLKNHSRQSERYDGIYKAEVTVCVKKSDLGYRPVTGQSMRLDGELYLVADCDEADGMLTIVLEASES
jgi:hypothetical protein